MKRNNEVNTLEERDATDTWSSHMHARDSFYTLPKNMFDRERTQEILVQKIDFISVCIITGGQGQSIEWSLI